MSTTVLDRPTPIVDDATRRQFLTGLAAAGLLAGCGSVEPPVPAATPSGGFPVRIDHAFGATEIPAEPQRIVTLGYNDMDAVFALGVAPVASRAWFTGEVINPWSAEAAGEAETRIMPQADGINFEAVAAADPDLIVAVNSELTAELYDTLSVIAPTLAWPAQYDSYTTPWQDQTRIIGRALGREARANELVAEVESAYAAAAARHPEWAGASAVLTSLYEGGNLLVYTANTPATSVLEMLGFVVPSELNEFFDEAFEVAALSPERLDVIDRDLIVSDALPELLEGAGYFDLPTYQNLDAVREGRVLYPSKEVVQGVTYRTVLSLPWALDRLEPGCCAHVRPLGMTPP